MKQIEIEFKFIEDIIYCDGSLLALGITDNNQPILIAWMDIDYEKNYNEYAYIFIKEEDLDLFLNEKKLYYEVLRDSHNIIAFKYNGEKYDFKEMQHNEYLKKYGPKEKVSLKEDLIDFRVLYQQFIEKEKSQLKIIKKDIV